VGSRNTYPPESKDFEPKSQSRMNIHSFWVDAHSLSWHYFSSD